MLAWGNNPIWKDKTGERVNPASGNFSAMCCPWTSSPCTHNLKSYAFWNLAKQILAYMARI